MVWKYTEILFISHYKHHVWLLLIQLGLEIMYLTIIISSICNNRVYKMVYVTELKHHPHRYRPDIHMAFYANETIYWSYTKKHFKLIKVIHRKHKVCKPVYTHPKF